MSYYKTSPRPGVSATGNSFPEFRMSCPVNFYFRVTYLNRDDVSGSSPEPTSISKSRQYRYSQLLHIESLVCLYHKRGVNLTPYFELLTH
ncbi:hypothetical protein CDAR_490521 [Caerostris darwini]|uniref:Uncharacterized protein n=1 Tax=Caerostris darwini TaxID=1538125 RepID=A0AAV4NM29_9ARAC|nr:hypothetical protein CDAR_490521 [Caerostris darwini]